MREACTLFLLLFLFACSATEAPAAWKINLVSGSTVEANSCRVEKGQVFLKFPVGEVSFPLSEVKSVFWDDQGAAAFQEKGVEQARKYTAPGADTNHPAGMPAAAAPGRQAPAMQAIPPGPPAAPGQYGLKPRFTPETLSELRSNSVEVKKPQSMDYDPEVEEIINGLEGADEARQAELEKKMNKLFEVNSPGGQP